MIHGMFHDQLHLIIRYSEPTRMEILNGPVAKRERDDRLRFPGDLAANGINAHGKPYLCEAIVAHWHARRSGRRSLRSAMILRGASEHDLKPDGAGIVNAFDGREYSESNGLQLSRRNVPHSEMRLRKRHHAAGHR